MVERCQQYSQAVLSALSFATIIFKVAPEIIDRVFFFTVFFTVYIRAALTEGDQLMSSPPF